MDHSESTSTPALASQPVEDLSPLEQDLLEEYERLAENMKKVWYAYLLIAMYQQLMNSAGIAGEHFRYHGCQADCGNPRRAEAAGAEDESGIHTVEGERV